MKKFGTKDNRLVNRARSLRTDSTNVERKLWYRLRDRQIKNCKFRRQHPIAGYVLDFACEALRLGIELDGGQHAESAVDQQRTVRLQQEGWHIMRFWNHDVLENIDGILTMISDAVERLAQSPSPENHEG